VDVTAGRLRYGLASILQEIFDGNFPEAVFIAALVS
jgi:hypothetical protein